MRKTKTIKCKVCGKERVAISNLDNAQYCSQKCFNIDRVGKRRADRKVIQCQQCGKDIELYASDNRTKFCSLACKSAAWSEYVHSPEFSKKIATGTYNYGTPRNAYERGVLHINRLNMDVKYRSSYERRSLEYFDQIESIIDLKYEGVVVEYEYNGGIHHTPVDYLLTMDNGKKILVEVKPINYMKDLVVIAKLDAAREYAQSNGWGFAVFNEAQIKNLSSVTTTLQAAMPTATTSAQNNEQRYSLNQLVTVGGEKRLLSRLLETFCK